MTSVTLKNTETQEVRIGIAGNVYLLKFYPFRGLMYADVRLGNEYVIAGKRVMANQWILPSYVTAGAGNVRFETYAADREDYVWYEGFNTKFRLVFYTGDEMAGMGEES